MNSLEQKSPVDGIRCDVAIAGGGLGGISAALSAAENGASVILVEASDHIGGTALYSGGAIYIRGAKTFEEFKAMCPRAHPVLGPILVGGFDQYVQWLMKMGAPGSYIEKKTGFRGSKNLMYFMGHSPLPRGRDTFFNFLRHRLERLGGRILFETRATGLLTRDGAVVGMVARSSDDKELPIHSEAVVLATGGFQANTEMLTKYQGDGGGEFRARAVHENNGDGLRMALEAGATTSKSMDTIYGHLVPASPCAIDWSDRALPALLSSLYSEQSIVVNAKGERFVDEGVGETNGTTINAAVKQPAGGLWVILDERLRREAGRYALPRGVLSPRGIRYLKHLRHMRIGTSGGLHILFDSIGAAKHRGAIVVQAKTPEELGVMLSGHGVNKENLVRTIREFNESIVNGATRGLPVPKSKDASPIRSPPFYAIKVAVGVSMTYGGVAINESTEALTKGGSPIRGLYAVPGTAGGIQDLYYGGALALCAVFGRLAGQNAAMSVTKH